MHAPKSRPSSADLPMPDMLQDRLLIFLANHWWAKEAELLLCKKLGKPMVRNSVALKIPRNTKELGDRACRAHAFRPMTRGELIDNDVAPSAISANCVTAMPLFEPMYSRKSLIIVELRQTARIVSGIEWEHGIRSGENQAKPLERG